MVVQSNTSIWEANKTQELIWDAITSGLYRYIMCGGSIRSGKTIGMLKALYVLCKVFPGSRWAVIRESSPVLKRTTIPSFWRTCPRPFFHPNNFNRQEMIAQASNGSEIMFLSESIKDDPDLLRFGGLEVNGFVMEQAEECQPKTFDKCIERAGSWTMENMPPPLVLLNCNPHQGWVKRDFYNPFTQGKLAAPYHFIPALLEHNRKHLAPEYLESLEQLKTKAPGLYRRMILGSWDAEDNLDQLISWNVLYECAKMYVPKLSDADLLLPEDQRPKPAKKKSLGIDAARFGADASVWTILEDFNVKGELIKIDTTTGPELCEKTERIIVENNIPHDRVFLDTVGLGGYAFDFLKKAGFNIQEFVAGAKPVDQFTEGGFKFKDLRSQAQWNMKIGMEKGEAGNITDEELKQDLGAFAYEVVGDKKIHGLSKDEIKKRIHRSPDKGDSYTMAYWGQIYDSIEPAPDFFDME